MVREIVSSSNILSVGYDPESETLEIEFKNRSIYEYYGVPKQVFEKLKSARSKGTFFHDNIRGKYAAGRVV